MSGVYGRIVVPVDATHDRAAMIAGERLIRSLAEHAEELPGPVLEALRDLVAICEEKQ